MAQLGFAPLKRLVLPSSTDGDQVWVDVKTEFMVGDLAKIEDATGTDNEKAFQRVAVFIVNWSYSDVPVDVSSVANLRRADFNVISDEFVKVYTSSSEGLSIEEKKASVSSSVPVQVEIQSASPDFQTTI